MKSFITIAAFLFLMSCNSSDINNTQTNTSPLESDETIEELYSLVNKYRQEKGLRELILDQSMNDIAYGHSSDMSTQKVAFGHSGFSSRCTEARQALGGGNLCLENVARGQKTAQSVFDSWINSSGHRENIESARVTHLGIGYDKDQYGKIYWTQLFLEKI